MHKGRKPTPKRKKADFPSSNEKYGGTNMKKLILLLFILVTFLVLTSCDNTESADESSLDTSNATSVEEVTSSEERNTKTSNKTPVDETKENADIIKYYTHYQARFNEHLLTDAPPVIISNYNELSEFIKRECLENSQNEVLSNITEKTFEEYFVLVMNDFTISSQHPEELLERTYKNFTVTEDMVTFYVNSYYTTCKIDAYSGIPARDFVCIPRSLYSNDLQDKTFKIYIENYCEADDTAIIICVETNKDGSQTIIIKDGDCGM